MISNVSLIVNKLKKETNNLSDIIYRKKQIGNNLVYIIYNEPLTSSDKISDFIVRSLTSIENNIRKKDSLIEVIENDISNFKISKVYNYENLCFYLHRGFTIILVDGANYSLALETKADISRGISLPETENTVRGAHDAFVEDFQINLGLIKKRIKTNDLWINTLNVGKYTGTKVGVLLINGVAKKELVDEVMKRLNKINISGIIDSSMLKNLIEKENKSVFPTIKSTERPDVVAKALLEGKIVIVVDNSPYALIIPSVLNDFFKTIEDVYGKSINVTFTRIIKHLAFWIALLTPAIYIALVTYNQEMIPTDLLVNFATQRDGVPFPAFFEAFIMMICFEILRESDLRTPSASGNALSIVGALILGDAAVNAGIVSPIMIIVIAITAISSLPFEEQEIINGLRWYRILFMIGGSLLGMVGVVVVFIYFISKLASMNTFGKPYLLPFTPINMNALKNSLIKFPLRKVTNRSEYLSDNLIMQRNDTNEES